MRDKETARVSDGREGQKERGNERGIGATQCLAQSHTAAPGCSLVLFEVKASFPPSWGCIEDRSWGLVCLLSCCG